VKDGALDREAFAALVEAAAKDEAVYLATATGAGRVAGFGFTGDPLAEAKAPTAEETTASLTESFKALGLSDDIAATAAKGRG
jgi:hypothetical protein